MQFQKRGKHAWRSVTFSKVAGFSLQHSSMDAFYVFKIVQMVSHRATHRICMISQNLHKVSLTVNSRKSIVVS